MTKREQRTRLIKLAATILHGAGQVSPYLDDHKYVPKRVPKRWWGWLSGGLYYAEHERKQWAIELRKIADEV